MITAVHGAMIHFVRLSCMNVSTVLTARSMRMEVHVDYCAAGVTVHSRGFVHVHACIHVCPSVGDQLVALPGSVEEAVVASPQLHGPARDLLTAAVRVVGSELNAAVLLNPVAPAHAASKAGAGAGSAADTHRSPPPLCDVYHL